MKQELIDFKKHYLSVADQIPEDSIYFKANVHKYRHSIDVLRIGQQLINEEPELLNTGDDFKTQARRALLFHDIGRFDENIKRYCFEQNHQALSAVSNKYDHGLLGFEILKNMPLYNDVRILFAVRFHGKLSKEIFTSEMWQTVKNLPQKDEILKILYLVQDADKLANIEAAKLRNRLRENIFYQQLTPENIIGPLSASVKEQFFTQNIVSSQNLRTYADQILMVLSWIFDLKYTRSYQLFLEKEYDVYLLQELATCQLTTTEYQHIKNILYAKKIKR